MWWWPSSVLARCSDMPAPAPAPAPPVPLARLRAVSCGPPMVGRMGTEEELPPADGPGPAEGRMPARAPPESSVSENSAPPSKAWCGRSGRGTGCQGCCCLCKGGGSWHTCSCLGRRGVSSAPAAAAASRFLSEEAGPRAVLLPLRLRRRPGAAFWGRGDPVLSVSLTRNLVFVFAACEWRAEVR